MQVQHLREEGMKAPGTVSSRSRYQGFMLPKRVREPGTVNGRESASRR